MPDVVGTAVGNRMVLPPASSVAQCEMCIRPKLEFKRWEIFLSSLNAERGKLRSSYRKLCVITRQENSGLAFSKTANIKRSQDGLAPFPGCSLGAACLRKWNAGGASLTCEVHAQDPGCAPGDRPRTQADIGGGAWSAPDMCPCAGALISVPRCKSGGLGQGIQVCFSFRL